jgi:hypothetical protein
MIRVIVRWKFEALKVNFLSLDGIEVRVKEI